MAQKVAFQRWRIFFWAMKMAGAAGAHSESDPARSKAYRELAELGKEALRACSAGTQDAFLRKLDLIEAQRASMKLDAMLGGTDAEVPEWLRK
jgi:hypothetical protein